MASITSAASRRILLTDGSKCIDSRELGFCKSATDENTCIECYDN